MRNGVAVEAGGAAERRKPGGCDKRDIADGGWRRLRGRSGAAREQRVTSDRGAATATGRRREIERSRAADHGAKKVGKETAYQSCLAAGYDRVSAMGIGGRSADQGAGVSDIGAVRTDGHQ